MSAAAARKPGFASHPARRAMLAKVHLAKKQLGLNESDYRAVLERVSGVASCSAMSDAALHDVIAEFQRLGWKAIVPAAKRGADHPAAKKARALWICLHQLGVVRNPSERALEAFAQRQLGCDRLQWADQALTYKLIEALKAMAERAGWKQDVAGHDPRDQALLLQERLVALLRDLLIAQAPHAIWFDFAERHPDLRATHPLPMARLRKLTAAMAAQLAAVRG